MRVLACCLGSFIGLASWGQSIFQKTYGEHHFGPQSFAASADAYYLAHENEIHKIDLDGEAVWVKEIMFGNTEANIYRLAYLDGALLVSGGHAAQQNYFMKLDTSGAVLWSNAVNYGDINLPTRIHAADGGYLVGGHRDFTGGGSPSFDITMTRWDAAGDLLWGKVTGDDNFHYYGWTSLVLPNGEILVAGNRENDVTGESHPLIARFDENGDPLWMKILVDESGFFTHLIPADLIATSDGEFALVGTTTNTFFNQDAHVLKINGDGQVLWAKRLFQIGWTESAHAVIEDSEQRLVVGGAHNLNSEPVEGHLARFELSGTFIDVLSLPRFDTPTPSGYYTGLGQDLVERVGTGYSYAGDCDTVSFGPPWQGIITTGPMPGASCYGELEAYPFTVNNYTWVDSLITVPGTVSAFAEVSATLTSSSITGGSFDVCSIPLALDKALEIAAPGRTLIHPVPAGDRITVDLSWSTGTIRYEVWDARGILVSEGTWADADPRSEDVRTLRPGMYVLRLSTPGRVLNLPWVKD